jgi:shikimate dehydrogenase
LAVLGDPVEHSLSPLLHSAAFAATGLIGSYVKRCVDEAGMAQAIAEIKEGALDGANVTMPHKELAAGLSDRLAATAHRAGAVNTLVRVADEVVGHNTDVAGIQAAWRGAHLPEDGPILLLGAGGAAAAALLAVEGRPVSVAARRTDAARRLIDRTGVDAAVVPWGSVVAGAVLVNATPIGMDGSSLPGVVLDGAGGLFDMAYGATATPAIALMQQRGMPAADGRQMLLHQAAAAFELWTGHQAPLEAMASALSSGVPAAR